MERIGDGHDGVERREEPPEADQNTQRPHALDFGALIEELPVFVRSFDARGKCIYLSRRWLDYTGRALASQLGDGWLESLHPDDRERVRARWQTAGASPRPFELEFRLRRDDGVYRWFESRIVPVRGAGGDLQRWTGTASDVHEAHETRAALRAGQEQLQGIVATSPGAVLSFRRAPDGSISFPFASLSAQTLYGVPADEMAKDASVVFAHIHPDDLPLVGTTIALSEQTMTAWRCDFRYLHPTDGVKWLAGHSMPCRDPDGGMTWNGVVVDVTAQKQRELELSTVKSQLDAALEAADMGVYVLDLQDDTTWVSDALGKLFGLAPESSQTYPTERWLEAVHPEDRSLVRAQLQQAATSEQRLAFDFRFKRADAASARFMSSRVRMVRGADGSPARLVGVVSDVTQHKLAADAQARSQKLEALGTLAGGIAHDFNNVLQAVIGRAALALDDLAPENSAREHVVEIAAAGAHAGDLVRRLLSFSRPREHVRTALDLRGAVAEALKIVRATIPTLVEIKTTLGANVPVTLADATEIQQIVINLATNASHAIGARHGLIELTLDQVTMNGDLTLPTTELKPGVYARLTVSDNGSGMDPGVAARVFDPYFTTKRPGEGTGLGLAVVASIMRSLAGTVTVYSQPGKGTTFRLYFPASTEQAQPKATETRTVVRGAGQSVLLVDDEAALTALGQASLQHLGYTPHAFSDSRQALAAFRLEPERYAAVVTDLSMPGLSGLDLAREIHVLRPELPVIVMSGYARPEERERAEAAGIARLVLKPISLPALAEVLAEVLRR